MTMALDNFKSDESLISSDPLEPKHSYIITSNRRCRFVPELDQFKTRIRSDACEKEQASGLLDATISKDILPYRDVTDALHLFLLLHGSNPNINSLEKSNLKIKVIQHARSFTGLNIKQIVVPQSLSNQLEECTTNSDRSLALIDLSVVVDRYLLWCSCLPRVVPFYALKANPDSCIASTLSLLGAGFDCASKAELEQVLKFPTTNCHNVIFANPCKSVGHILYAKMHGIDMMTFDNIYELEKIAEHYPEARLVLRLLPDDSHSLMPFGSKFGASLSECKQLLARSRQLQMNVIGVSFHIGSGCYSAVAWIDALQLAHQVFNEALKYDYVMTLVDIGGGFSGHEESNISLPLISPLINETIESKFGPHVRFIAEPGRYFCEKAVTLAFKVISKRRRLVLNSQHESQYEFQYYLSDGIYGSMNCIVFDHAKPEPQLLARDGLERDLYRTTMWGPTCDSIDVIFKDIFFPETHIGEWIFFENMGAYTTSAGSTFNGVPKPKFIHIANIYVSK